jgi:3-hydroxyisobutyrate dehydrogenase-like beta-hydroxyacid dehydrogenase
MANGVIGIIGTGDMGSAVGASFLRAGYRVVTDSSGRSALSRRLADAAGIEDLGSLEAVAGAAELLLSILPPAAAFGFAERAARAMRTSGSQALYADCNAVAPATVEAIAALFGGAEGPFLDVGIVGPAPNPAAPGTTRFYVSGALRARLLERALPELAMIDMGRQIGRASAIKMCYAAMNKGTNALYTAVLMAAERLGVRAELMVEFDRSQPRAAEQMARRVPFLAATAARFTGEMREIAATFAAAGVTPRFHEGAEWLYAALAETPLAAETRATLPERRSLDEAIEIFVRGLDARA